MALLYILLNSYYIYGESTLYPLVVWSIYKLLTRGLKLTLCLPVVLFFNFCYPPLKKKKKKLQCHNEKENTLYPLCSVHSQPPSMIHKQWVPLMDSKSPLSSQAQSSSLLSLHLLQLLSIFKAIATQKNMIESLAQFLGMELTPTE